MKTVDFKKVYEILDRFSPIEGDCGKLCGAACCQVDSEGEEMGMYLLPGEESMQDPMDSWLDWEEDNAQDYDFPDSWKGKVYFVRCHGPNNCNRKRRPVQCRTFPLAPHLTQDGTLQIIVSDLDLPYVCPLVLDYQKIQGEFVDAVYEAWKLLLEDQRIYDLVYEDSRARDEAGQGYVMASI